MADATPFTPRVLIVGAGPVGCVGALLLARAGIAVTLVEKNAELPEDLRASTFHPPTLDMLDRLDLTRYLIDNGLIADRYQYRDRSAEIYAEFDLAVLGEAVKNPYRVQCEQFKLTRHVVSILQDMPEAQVRLGTALTGYAQDAGGVTATLDTDAGSEEIRADYIIGCDGAGSTVRDVMGVEFKGFTYPEQFLVVATDADLESGLPNLAHVNYVSGSEDWCVILRVLGNWRVLFPTDPDADPACLKDPAIIETRLQKLAPRDTPYPILHKSLGGMGMNGGLHDIFNLMGKLIPVLEGSSDAAALDLYDRQRRTVTTEFTQAQTIANKKRIEEQDDDRRIGRIVELQGYAADPAQAVAYLRKANMLDALERAASID